LNFEEEASTLTYTEFKENGHDRFGPPVKQSKFKELSKLKQIGLTVDYQRRFEQLLARSEKMTKSQEVEMYVSGLQGSIWIDVEVQPPQSLAMAM